jgi:Phycobilisome Linker polypeptide
MTSTFINPVVNPDAKLGMRSFDDTEPIHLCSNPEESDVAVVIRAVYRQVLGNAHVMESERLVVAESQLKRQEISVREFVRQVAQSDLYRVRFFEPCSRARSIELNFKHLLGRAPESREEVAEHGQILDWGSFESEIGSYLDSEEYQDAFGEDTVPYYRGHKTQAGRKMIGFTHMFQIVRGSASSDKDLSRQNRSRLNASLMNNRPSVITPVVGAIATQAPLVPTDVNQLLAGVFAQKTDASVAPTTANAYKSDADRQGQFYEAYQPYKEADPVELCPGYTDSDADVVIRAVYRQVLGNAHVMESERLVVAESQLKRGELSVREFVRCLAKSEFYRSRFFDACYRYRSIELNYKHLLGRAPDNFDEMRYHSSILDRQGFEADIDSYLDSDEYQAAFGENFVPYYRGYRSQPGQSMMGFTNMLQLVYSASSSDRDLATNNQPQLTRSIIQNSPYGKLQTSNVEDILAEVFKRPMVPSSSQTAATPTAKWVADAAVQKTLREQTEEIARLQQQLADLRPAATVGAAYIKSDWQPASVPETISSALLQQQAAGQTAQIAALQEQIADARRYSAIGEARLNKWRSRAFNS